MIKLQSILLMVSLFIIVACSPNNTMNNNMIHTQTSNTSEQSVVVYWVNSHKAHCTGVAEMQCLQVQKSEHWQENSWQYFYDDIADFQYQSGYMYKLLVKEEQRPANEIPADASSIKYTLIKVLEKNQVASSALNAIWFLNRIEGKTINASLYRKIPQLMIDTSKMSISGNDSCNDFFAQIKTIQAKNIVFMPIASTKMFCANMNIAKLFHQHIINISSYNVADSRLSLLNAQGAELMSFTREPNTKPK